MPLWQWTLYSLGLTAVLGLLLFCGYTFRLRIVYPFALVTGHVVSATVTMILFCVLLYHLATDSANVQMYAQIIAWVSFAALIVTFLSGLYFYLWFNARRRGLKNGMLVTHLLMAAVSFSFAVSGVAGIAGTQPTDRSHLYPPSMYNFHKHQHTQTAE